LKKKNPNEKTYISKFELLIDNKRNKIIVDHIFKELLYQSFKASNDIVTQLWDVKNNNYAFKNKYNHYFNMHDLGIKQKTDAGYVYDSIKNKYSKISPSTLSTLIRKVSQEYNALFKDICVGEKSIPSYKKTNINIYLSTSVAGNQIKIEPAEKVHKRKYHTYNLSLRLLSKAYAEDLYKNGFDIKRREKGKKREKTFHYSLPFNDTWINFCQIQTNDDYQQSIIDNILDGTYKLSTSYIKYNRNKRKWMLFIAYTFVPKHKTLDENKIMGIDVGINNPATLAIDGTHYHRFVGSRSEIDQFYKRVEGKKRQMQHQAAWCGSGRCGHGYSTRMKPVLQIRNRISNFKKVKNHCWSKYIINEAIKNGCGTIQMEDLSGIVDTNPFLRKWTYFELQQDIIYKAEKAGIKMVKVDPHQTSARCNRCGYLNDMTHDKKTWRPNQPTFICQNCDHKNNADINAARNIAMKDIDKIIKEQHIIQEKAELVLK
jgi:IS605 OrfB family transposase